jgi:hypothetical protein
MVVGVRALRRNGFGRTAASSAASGAVRSRADLPNAQRAAASAPNSPFGPQKQVLGRLLGDGGTAARPAEIVVGLLDRLAHRAEVDAAIAAEGAVFGDDDGERQCRGNAVERDDDAFDARSRGPPPQHRRRDRLHEPVQRGEQVGERQQQEDDDSATEEEASPSRP